MRSLCLVMSECFLSGRGQGHVDLENFATASRRYTGDIHNSPVVGLFMTPTGQWKRLDRVPVECTCLLHIGPQPTVTLQLHNFDLFTTCRTIRTSFCTVACQLARFQLTRRIARSLGDCWASCLRRKNRDFSDFILSTIFCVSRLRLLFFLRSYFRRISHPRDTTALRRIY